METVQANNYFEPHKNDFEYSSLKKDEAMLNIMENNSNRFYDTEEDNLQSLNEIIEIDKILD